MVKENKDSYQLMEEMNDEIRKVIGNFKGDIINVQKEEIKALENQITDKWTDKDFVLMKREDLRDLMEDVHSAKGYTEQAEEEASSSVYGLEEAQSQSNYASDDLSSVYDKLEEFARMHEKEEEINKGENSENK